MKLVLGTAQFGLNYGINNKFGITKYNEVQKILNYAYNYGIKFLDTAYAYGQAHEIIGLYHQDNPKNQFKIITKIPKILNNTIIDEVVSYIKILKINTLHAVLFHSIETIEKNPFLLKDLFLLKKENIIEFTGVSVYTNEDLNKAISNDLIDIIQVPYNLFDNINQKSDLLTKAKLYGKIIQTRSVFLQGLFFMNNDSNNVIYNHFIKELKIINNISNFYKIPLNKLALNYCYMDEKIDQILFGVDTVEQLRNNIEFNDFQLPHEVINEINKINFKSINLLNPTNWG